MRPAKSFWKNAQDWRTTYQWFCHLMRFDTFAEIAWFARREWPEVPASNFSGLWAGRGWPPERG
jgi:hypothetical protein